MCIATNDAGFKRSTLLFIMSGFIFSFFPKKYFISEGEEEKLNLQNDKWIA